MDKEAGHRGDGDGTDWNYSCVQNSWDEIDPLVFPETTLVADEENLFNQTCPFDDTKGLGDLSCSLIQCEQFHDQDEIDQKVVENLEVKIRNRDSNISKLTDSLKGVVSKLENGDVSFSFEKQLAELSEGLIEGSFLTSTPNVNACKEVGVVTEQEDPIPLVQKNSKLLLTENFVSLQSRGTSPIIFCDQLYAVQGITKSVERSHVSSEDKNLNTNQEDGPPEPNELCGPNYDSLRLTFSPSIFYYEAEAPCNSDSEIISESDNKVILRLSSLVEDLKLQITNTERNYEATKRFLNEMSIEREQEREEFQRNINDLTFKYEECKKHKLTAQRIIEQQRSELNELENALEKKRLIGEALVRKLETSEDGLKQTVEKVLELREIIKTLEERIEHTTIQAKNVGLTGMVEESDLQNDATNISQTHHREDDGISEIDHNEELQAQLEDLARKVEDKLIELESFSWQSQNCPSYFSVRSDDASVRLRPLNPDDSSDSRDIISRVFRGLRKLEGSFNGLVRFEEVLLKKMKDAELKSALEDKHIKELQAENSKLKIDILNCRTKIKDFETFLNDGTRMDLSRSVERLRNVGLNRSRHVDFNDSLISFRGAFDQMESNKERAMDVIEESEAFESNLVGVMSNQLMPENTAELSMESETIENQLDELRNALEKENNGPSGEFASENEVEQSGELASNEKPKKYRELASENEHSNELASNEMADHSEELASNVEAKQSKQSEGLAPENEVVKYEELASENEVEKSEELAPENEVEKSEELAPENEVVKYEELVPENEIVKYEELASENEVVKYEELASENEVEKFEELAPENEVEKYAELASENEVEKYEELASENEVEKYEELASEVEKFGELAPEIEKSGELAPEVEHYNELASNDENDHSEELASNEEAEQSEEEEEGEPTVGSKQQIYENEMESVNEETWYESNPIEYSAPDTNSQLAHEHRTDNLMDLEIGRYQPYQMNYSLENERASYQECGWSEDQTMESVNETRWNQNVFEPNPFENARSYMERDIMDLTNESETQAYLLCQVTNAWEEERRRSDYFKQHSAYLEEQVHELSSVLNDARNTSSSYNGALCGMSYEADLDLKTAQLVERVNQLHLNNIALLNSLNIAENNAKSLENENSTLKNEVRSLHNQVSILRDEVSMLQAELQYYATRNDPDRV